jgi:nucleotide-binding universal stress UspA family protein
MAHGATIVVGFDGHDAALRALARAVDEARSRRGRVVVVSVAEMPLDPGAPRNFGTLDDGPVQALPHVVPPELQPVIAAARAQLDDAGVGAEYLWAVGDAAHAIVAAARERKADLVVLGAHHGGFLSKLVGSNVAADVERGLGCDVLVVD